MNIDPTNVLALLSEQLDVRRMLEDRIQQLEHDLKESREREQPADHHDQPERR